MQLKTQAPGKEKQFRSDCVLIDVGAIDWVEATARGSRSCCLSDGVSEEGAMDSLYSGEASMYGSSEVELFVHLQLRN
ncbi:hypothetical protein Y032_0020g223 [Ancylostoma ceylanicum]|uniref:Uncharacterized protein n=1 Tax=Ancylostoma ceylanicum TaxID=53326 RepID=A0A016V0D5_9BILA|nr:hypothetical protein Y032_0020g223 [Ancylostoma ceylanicum]